MKLNGKPSKPASRRRNSSPIRQAMDGANNDQPEDTVFMLPWCLPKESYLAVRRILPNIHIAKMRYYFDDYGCIRCERRDVLYRTNGLCQQCTAIVRWRLTHCLKKRLSSVGIVATQGERELSLAKELLKPFHRRIIRGAKSKSTRKS